MRMLAKVQLRLRSLFRWRHVEGELDAELRFHLDQLIAENLSSDMTHDEARWAARRMTGDVTEHQEACRDVRRVHYIEDLIQDLRLAIRSLAKSPGFAAVVVVIDRIVRLISGRRKPFAGIANRTEVIYWEGRRKMTIAGEMVDDGSEIYAASTTVWDDSDGELVDEAERKRILGNVKASLEAQGARVVLNSTTPVR